MVDLQRSEYERKEQAEYERKVKEALAKIEPIVPDVDMGRFRYEASTAVSMKRIADTLDLILVELQHRGGRA